MTVNLTILMTSNRLELLPAHAAAPSASCRPWFPVPAAAQLVTLYLLKLDNV